MQRRKPRKIAGLWLWAVYMEKYSFHLWITTRHNSIIEATDKAVRLVARKYSGAKIIEIKQHGQLDA